jgi:two-component system, OmpR family, response regulator
MNAKRVLLVEDEPDIQKIVRLSLTLLGDYEVSIAGTGAEALELAVQTRPDLILLDVMLPEADGYQTCLELRQKPETRAIPVIFISAKAQQAEVAHGLSLGAIGYITKPFDPMLLPDQIREIVGQRDGCAPTRYCDQLTEDPMSVAGSCLKTYER